MTETNSNMTPELRNERAYPFCPGCGHGPILDHLSAAMAKNGLNPTDVVIVSDIGCSGLSDQYFNANAFHGLHGRSITYASGIKLARPELEVVVIMGDGGTGIGGAHLLSAARRNIGITVIIMNNFNFGMTGGQHSTTTPTGATTSTTPLGNLEQPLDICATVGVNGANFAYRGTSFDRDLADRIAEAMRRPGFALLDIWELCTAYYVPKNRLSKSGLNETLDNLGFANGLLYENDHPEFSHAYEEFSAEMRKTARTRTTRLESAFATTLSSRFDLVVAGSAGAKVRSAVATMAKAGLVSGLHVAQSDDYPITVQTGHSVSDLILSPQPIHFAAVETPQALLILSQDGLAKSQRHLANMKDIDHVFVLPEFSDVETRAQVEVIDFSNNSTRITRTSMALAATAAVAARLGLVSRESLDAIVAMGKPAFRAQNESAIAAGFS